MPLNVVLKKKDRTRQLERKVEKNVDEALAEAAEALVGDISENWSDPPAPSAVGQAPALDTDVNTGNLSKSVFKERGGRDLLGRFAKAKDAQAWVVIIDATRGPQNEGRGHYETLLEPPGKFNRPFVAPAIQRLSGVFPFFFRSIFKVKLTGGDEE